MRRRPPPPRASLTARQRSIFGCDVLAVQLAVLRVELAVDVRDLAHEERQSSPRAAGSRSAAACEHARRAPRRAPARAARPARSQAIADRDVAERGEAAAEPRHEHAHQLDAPGDVARHRPGVVEARRERKDAVASERARSVGLKPAMPQHAAGIRIEPPESVPSAASASPAASAAAEPPLEPPDVRPGRGRVRHRAVVQVLRGDAVGELVQVRLADVDVPGRLERGTASAVSDGTWSAKTADPYVVRTPAVSNRSLTASRIPSPAASSVMKIPSTQLEPEVRRGRRRTCRRRAAGTAPTSEPAPAACSCARARGVGSIASCISLARTGRVGRAEAARSSDDDVERHRDEEQRQVEHRVVEELRPRAAASSRARARTPSTRTARRARAPRPP